MRSHTAAFTPQSLAASGVVGRHAEWVAVWFGCHVKTISLRRTESSGVFGWFFRALGVADDGRTNRARRVAAAGELPFLEPAHGRVTRRPGLLKTG